MSVILLTSAEASEWKTHHVNSHDPLHMPIFVYACQNRPSFLCSFSTCRRSDSRVWSVCLSVGLFLRYVLWLFSFSLWFPVLSLGWRRPRLFIFPLVSLGPVGNSQHLMFKSIQSSNSINHRRHGQLDNNGKCRNHKWLFCPFAENSLSFCCVLCLVWLLLS